MSNNLLWDVVLHCVKMIFSFAVEITIFFRGTYGSHSFGVGWGGVGADIFPGIVTSIIAAVKHYSL